MADDFGRVLCNGCKMDLFSLPEDYEGGAREVYCGHCENDRHVCPDERYVAIIRTAVNRIKSHEASWLAMLREGVPSYDLEENLADDGEETDRLDFIQNEQAHDAQLLLRSLMKEFQEVAA